LIWSSAFAIRLISLRCLVAECVDHLRVLELLRLFLGVRAAARGEVVLEALEAMRELGLLGEQLLVDSYVLAHRGLALVLESPVLTLAVGGALLVDEGRFPHGRPKTRRLAATVRSRLASTGGR